MLNIENIKKIYEKYDVKASKRFGQNFLVDQESLSRIIEISSIKNKDVVEIGPGLGSLTKLLLEKASSVTSYEIDRDMIKVLNEEINHSHFKLIEGDFLKQSIDWDNKKTVVANIPYNITTDILFYLIQNSSKIDKAFLMVQKEVALRATAKVKSTNYGKLSITLDHFADVKYEFTVPRTSFFPSPKVDSAMVSLTFKDVNFDEEKEFIKFVKLCFTMRRKTILNNLKNFMDKEKALAILDKTKIDPSIRPQEISRELFIELFSIYK